MRTTAKLLILIGIFISMRVLALEESSYDESTQVLSIPSLVIKDKGVFRNTKLLLNLNGTWDILNLEQKPKINSGVTGYWRGKFDNFGENICFHGADVRMTGKFDILLSQSGNKLNGIVIGYRPCTSPIGHMGDITGTVDGENISFTIRLRNQKNKEEIKFIGKAIDNFSTINGTVKYREETMFGETMGETSLSLSLKMRETEHWQVW